MDFESVKSLCILIGCPRNNFDVYGNLLDANPEIAINHHYSCLELLHRYRASSKDVLISLLCRSRDYLNGEKKYVYKVPGWFQGKCSEKRVEVVGDYFGYKNLNFIKTSGFDSLKRLQDVVKVPVRIIHIVRNPFHNIFDIAKSKYHNDISDAIDCYSDLIYVIKELEDQKFCDIRTIEHGRFMKDPMVFLLTICDFLGINVSNYYLECCAKEIFKIKQNLLFTDMSFWKKDQIDRVNKLCKDVHFLEDYYYDKRNQ